MEILEELILCMEKNDLRIFVCDTFFYFHMLTFWKFTCDEANFKGFHVKCSVPKRQSHADACNPRVKIKIPDVEKSLFTWDVSLSRVKIWVHMFKWAITWYSHVKKKKKNSFIKKHTFLKLLSWVHMWQYFTFMLKFCTCENSQQCLKMSSSRVTLLFFTF